MKIAEPAIACLAASRSAAESVPAAPLVTMMALSPVRSDTKMKAAPVATSESWRTCSVETPASRQVLEPDFAEGVGADARHETDRHPAAAGPRRRDRLIRALAARAESEGGAEEGLADRRQTGGAEGEGRLRRCRESSPRSGSRSWRRPRPAPVWRADAGSVKPMPPSAVAAASPPARFPAGYDLNGSARGRRNPVRRPAASQFRDDDPAAAGRDTPSSRGSPQAHEAGTPASGAARRTRPERKARRDGSRSASPKPGDSRAAPTMPRSSTGSRRSAKTSRAASSTASP